ncbi:HMG box domain-containing protein [Mycena indigotica]|uniref:HMG box domain-containing protein n=1 Tax=Mycena indigotica TaxID=2126181 RepID=A0A8H6SWP1_9AGAR|nr:HMG box domain-containing protein [Mycena indigotica]KAF7306510.1 HMG box domain-containing protein [Mycena indigotica]
MAPRQSRRLSTRQSISKAEPEEYTWELPSPPSYDSDLDVGPSPSARKPNHSSTHIPRPPNQFICFRSDWWAKNKHRPDITRDHRQISRLAGIEWRALPDAERAKYAVKAEIAKQRHAKMFPQYHYKPGGRSSTSSKGKKRKVESDDDADEWVPSSVKRRKFQQATSPPFEASAVFASPLPSTVEEPSTPELAADTSSESSEPQSVISAHDTESVHEDASDDFVLTADIPPLDLYATTSVNKNSTIFACDASHVPPALQHNVDSQFFKPEVSTEARDMFLWCNQVQFVDEPDFVDDPYFVPDVNSEILFTNPFAMSFTSEFDQLDAPMIGL